jgi:hypothetical protein
MDRFLDTGRMLKDYYRCMQAPIPDEINGEYPRLPLIDVSCCCLVTGQSIYYFIFYDS